MYMYTVSQTKRKINTKFLKHMIKNSSFARYLLTKLKFRDYFQ